MAIHQLLRDDNGALVLPGKVRKTLTATFGSDGVTSIPSWLTLTTGTAAIVQSVTTGGELQLSSPSGATGTLSSADTYLMSKFEAMLIEVEGLYTPDSNFDHYTLSINASNIGGVFCAVTEGSGNTFMKQNLNGSTAGEVDFSFNATTSGWQTTPYNLGVLLLPRAGHAYLLEGDQVLGDADYSGGSGSAGTLLSGAVNFTFNNIASSGVTVAHIKQIRLTTTSY